MDVLAQFNHFIQTNKLVSQQDKVLLAVSGGKDSMLMLWLFLQAGIAVEIAHCNFNLRGEESDADEQLVADYAHKHAIPVHVRSFDTTAYATKQKISIQLAARELRYDWFEKLRKERSCDLIAIAQHKNDNAETLLFNLSRGTGLKGLKGIQQKRESIIRPILFLDSAEIASLVTENNIPFRDDSSNFLNKYARNKIRLDIIPEFEKLNPDFISVMEENMVRFQDSIDVLEDFVKELRDRIFIPQGKNTWSINKDDLKNRKIGLLYLLFEPYHFSKSVLQDLFLSFAKESGRIFEAPDYVILSDRDKLFLKKKKENNTEVTITYDEDARWVWGTGYFEVQISEDCTIEKDVFSAKLDVEKLVYPLVIRTWKEGDIFQPLGMKGKKKISDFFIQRKVNVFEKKEIPLLINGNNDIIWIAGYQLDDRYKITENTKKVLKLVFHKK